MEEIIGYWLRTFPIVFGLRVSLKIYFLQQWIKGQRQIDSQMTICNRISLGKVRDDFRSNDRLQKAMLVRSEKKMKWERNKICFKERTLNIDMGKWHQRSLCFFLGFDLHVRRFYSQVTLERLVALLPCNSHFDRRIWQRLHTITVSAVGWSWKVWWICHILSNSSSLLFKIWVRQFRKFSLHNWRWSLFDMMVDVSFEKLKNKDKFEMEKKREKLLVRRALSFWKM